MTQEIRDLQGNHAWEVVDLPPNKVSIGCKLVYEIEYEAYGSVEMFKARLVALRDKTKKKEKLSRFLL